MSKYEPLIESMYLTACHIFVLLNRKSRQCAFFWFWIASWYIFTASLAWVFKLSTDSVCLHHALMWFLVLMYLVYKCVRFTVHHLLVYEDGFTLGVTSYTVFQTVSVSSSVCFCTDVFKERSLSLCVRTSQILFQRAFLQRSLFFLSQSDKTISNVIVMTWWSDSCSVS